MLAAITASEKGNQVELFDHNEKLGKKLFITGKGRCNVTNACDTEKLLENVVSNKKFLYSACYGFDSYSCMDFFEKLGVKLKVERGNRVFPQSDHSSDIIRALADELQRLGVKIHLHAHVERLITKKSNTDIESDAYLKTAQEKEKKRIVKIVLRDGREYPADAVILATGGASYPLTGSDGSGFAMVKSLGHCVTNLYPALVPLHIKESFCRELMGLSLKNVSVTVFDGKKKLFHDFGEMLFTHYGVSGPLILSASSIITKKLGEKELRLLIDLKPALSIEQLDKRMLRDFEKMKNKQLKNALSRLLPSGLIPVLIQMADLEETKNVNAISKNERARLVRTFKQMELTIIKTADFKEAIITQGGISVKEINPSTMESKLIKNLYFAGECIDIDAFTGGYNLQLAWATARLAALSAGE